MIVEGSTVSDPRLAPGGGGGGRSPLFLDQTEALRAEKNFMETAPRPTLSQGLDLAMVYLEDTTRGY